MSLAGAAAVLVFNRLTLGSPFMAMDAVTKVLSLRLHKIVTYFRACPHALGNYSTLLRPMLVELALVILLMELTSFI